MSVQTVASTQWHDFEDAAKLLGVSAMTLRRMAKNREIGHRRVGSGRGTYRFSDEHIAEYLNARTVQMESRAA